MATQQSDISATPPAPDYNPETPTSGWVGHEYSSDDQYKRRSAVRIVVVSAVATLVVLSIILGLSLIGGSG